MTFTVERKGIKINVILQIQNASAVEGQPKHFLMNPNRGHDHDQAIFI